MATTHQACSIEGCNNPTGVSGSARGWCRSHYKRWKTHGDPLAGKAMRGEAEKWAKEIAAREPVDECVLWPFAMGGNGYGNLRLSTGGYKPAYNYICHLAHGERPTPLHEAAHSCGNRACVNPGHLRWATRSENAQDKNIHGTMVRGEDVHVSKLTEADVRKIRNDLAFKSQHELAAEFGVNQSSISDIARKRSWRWLK